MKISSFLLSDLKRQGCPNGALFALTGIKNDFVFVTQYNKGYKTAKVITELLKELCITCNLKVGTLHTVRKSCNTLLKQYKMPQDWILDQLGHVEDGVNREYYTGRIKPDMSEIGKVLSELKIG